MRWPEAAGHRLALLAVLVLGACAGTEGGGAPGTLAVRGPAAATLLAHDIAQSLRLADVGGALYRADPRPRDGYAYCSNSIALAERGEFRAAVEEAAKALYLGQRSGDQFLIASAARDLAYAFVLAGAADTAEFWANEALAAAGRSIRPPQALREVLGPARKTLGDVALRRQRPAEAAALYRQAAEAGTEAFRPLAEAGLARALAEAGDLGGATAALERARSGAPHLAAWHDRLAGEIALRGGDAAQARELFRAAAEGARADEDSAYHRVWAQAGLARAERALGSDRAALEAYRAALAGAEAVRARFRTEEFKAGLFGDLQQVFDEAVALAWTTGDRDGAFAIAEQGRSRAFLDLVRGRGGARHAPAPGAAAAAIRAALPQNLALAVYHLGDGTGRAWVLRREGITPVALDIGGTEAAALVVAWRRAAGGRGDEAAEARRLHVRLIAPLGLRPGEDLIVVPHRALFAFPFQAALGPRGRLIEERAVAYLPAASLAAAASRARGSAPLVALANPDLGAPDLDLPGAEREAGRIAALAGEGNARLLVRGAATAAALMAEAPRAGMLHLAAHARVDPLDALSSQIFLAPSGGDSGVVQARRFYELDLTRARLVVLSACETGLGVVGRGDEFYGFQRTILAAGAGGILATLWEIADESTAPLMEGFYRHLGAGATPRQALQRAAVSLLRDGRHAHPYYWAAFNLVGAF
ncbi:hypothetical protein GCM10010964_16680 [Caldovatus sediminis]|uniref:CHAT domain-containing protein n=1 Tax=Caldovatus sediminis TaxID=2041189 RepID=A0A8J2ZAU2_9PROT|nr:CHAT domain-containing protein [Caldovatus sediminis]GGG29488.1 hypothetical protein GCM10010964_16680 [Caldovatus sediminis]